MSCFLVLDWPIPSNLICSYFETAAAINGLDIEGLKERAAELLEACDLYGSNIHRLPRKDYMRDLILTRTLYPEQWLEIAEYNRDACWTHPLLETIGMIDVERALFRGRYGVAVARIDACGTPTSAYT